MKPWIHALALFAVALSVLLIGATSWHAIMAVDGLTTTSTSVVRWSDTAGKQATSSLVTIDNSGSVNIPSGQHYQINSGNLSYGDVGAAPLSHPAPWSTVTETPTTLAGYGITVPTGTINSYPDNVLFQGSVGSPAESSLADWFKYTRSAGRLTGGAVTAHSPANGTCDVSQMDCMTFTSNALAVDYIYCRVAATSSLALTDTSVSWVYFDYNAGSPRFLATTDRSTIHEYDQFSVGRVYREGNTVEVLTTGHSLYDKDRRSHNRLIVKYGAMDHATGGTIGAVGTRGISVTAGTWYIANTQISTAAKDTSTGDTFTTFYRSAASTWTKTTGQTQVNNTQYNDLGTNTLATLTANRYGVHWVFVCPEGNLYVVYGQGDYTLAQAQALQVPSTLPPYCVNWARFVGKIIVQKSATSFYSIESAFQTNFSTSAVTAHNDLSGLQGGTSGEYYHLTSAQHGALGASPVLYAETTLPYDAVRNLYTNPALLVAAPGTGNIVTPMQVLVTLDYGGAAYNNQGLLLRYGSASGGSITSALGAMNATVDTLWQMAPAANTIGDIGTYATNKSLVLHCGGALGSTGNSPLYVRVWYAVTTVGF